jgi:hypothetical protein
MCNVIFIQFYFSLVHNVGKCIHILAIEQCMKYFIYIPCRDIFVLHYNVYLLHATCNFIDMIWRICSTINRVETDSRYFHVAIYNIHRKIFINFIFCLKFVEMENTGDKKKQKQSANSKEEDRSSSDGTKNGSESKSRRKPGGVGAARQRYKMGKSWPIDFPLVVSY